jgi:arylsulfatase A-like enzyme
MKKSNRKSGLKETIIFSCIVVIFACNKPLEKVKPNILYIFTDDQSFRTVSAYPESYEWVHTPNIDRLAEEGMRFSNCYPGTWCMASRATALTGLLQHGIHSLKMTGPYPGNEYDPEVLRFWPSVFRESGYYTGIIGKWHTGSDDGAGRDWDYSAVWNHAAGGNGGYYLNQKISFNGKEPVSVGGYSTDNYTNYALEFINKRAENKDQPWYLWLCYDATHSPYITTDRHKVEYVNSPPVAVPDDIFPPRPGKPSHLVNYNDWWETDNQGNPLTRRKIDGKQLPFDDFIRKYNRAVLPIDEGVGKILDALESTGQLNNTLVVFTSDQGFAISQHGFLWKYAPYDATLKAPLIIRWPEKIAGGQVCEHPVGGHDLIATFFSVAGIELPWKMHGHDISPMLQKPDCQWDNPLLLVNTQRLYGKDTKRSDFPINRGIPSWVSIREKNYKYIRYLIDNEIEELYDLEKDPSELINLALSPEYKKQLESIRQKLIDELKRTDAEFVENLPDIKTEL